MVIQGSTGDDIGGGIDIMHMVQDICNYCGRLNDFSKWSIYITYSSNAKI